MASRFWNFVLAMVPGSLAKGEDVNENLSGIDTALALIETEIDGAIRVTTSPGTTAIAENAASRANKLIQFNSAGGIELGTVVGDWKGDHADAAGTDYYVRDVVRDAAAAIGLNNLYICTTAHTSTGDILADTANWSLLINVVDVETAKTAAESARDDAQTAQAAAELVYDNFDDRYLGSKAAEPALDNDGAALITGALFFHAATVNRMKIYNGAAWQLTTANAVDVVVTDADGHLVAANVEAALAEIAILTKFLTVTQAVNLDTIEDNQIHTGDVTGTKALTIANDAVTNAKAANMAQDRIKGRANGAGTGDPTDLAPAQVRSIINVENGADVTDATNVNAAGAVMNTDTSTASMQFVIDEDTMASNLATKVPSQQSVKAFVESRQIPSRVAPIANTLTINGWTTITVSGADYVYIHAIVEGIASLSGDKIEIFIRGETDSTVLNDSIKVGQSEYDGSGGWIHANGGALVKTDSGGNVFVYVRETGSTAAVSGSASIRSQFN